MDDTNSLMLNLPTALTAEVVDLLPNVVGDSSNRHLWTCWAGSWAPNFPTLPPPLFILRAHAAQTIIIATCLSGFSFGTLFVFGDVPLHV